MLRQLSKISLIAFLSVVLYFFVRFMDKGQFGNSNWVLMISGVCAGDLSESPSAQLFLLYLIFASAFSFWHYRRQLTADRPVAEIWIAPLLIGSLIGLIAIRELFTLFFGYDGPMC